ncbi:MAG: PaaX family transcriptional regulator [Rhodobacteraceae bacterium]|nr:PaaX family transcriptional regulator [Paracoccaceae bacterium]
MRDTPQTWFDKSLEILTYNRNQMVWSILVTIFGDLARRPGDQISGALLSRLTDPMGIKPEAMRVALHRLRNDGWITSERQGRTSRYSLTPHGLTESDAASPRIYAESSAAPDASWHLLIGEPASAAQRGEADKLWRGRGYIVVGPGTYLGRGAPPSESANFLVMSAPPAHVPNWLRNKIGTPDLAAAYRALEDALDRALPLLQNAPHMTPIEAAILRVVIVHNWRRALLAHPDLPEMVFPENWRGTACRKKVMEALAILPRPSPEMLEKAVNTA